MSTVEICKYLQKTPNEIRSLVDSLGMKGVGKGKVKKYSNIEIARMKAGLKYKDYVFVQDMTRYWIFYGFKDNKEIRIEI